MCIWIHLARRILRMRIILGLLFFRLESGCWILPALVVFSSLNATVSRPEICFTIPACDAYPASAAKVVARCSSAGMPLVIVLKLFEFASIQPH